MKKVYGSYLNAAAARKAVNELLDQGYTRNDIKVVSNKELDTDLSPKRDDVHEEERGLWEKIKDAFTFDEYGDDYWDKDLETDERTALEGYKVNLQAGEIIVLLAEGKGQNLGEFHEGDTEFDKQFKDGAPDWDEREKEFNEDLGDEDERVMELKKEKLNIDKEEVETGEVEVRKVLREETQTVEVPVEKEEIIIERRSAGDRKVRDGETIDTDSFKEGEEIHIPIKEERVNVSKSTVVDDEVVIRKDKHTEDKTVSEKVRREDIEVEGDAEVRGDKDKYPEDLDNMDKDPLRNRDLNDDGLRTDDLKDLDRDELNKKNPNDLDRGKGV